MSAPHIYHSALPLSPKTSIVWGLYKKYAHPLVRVVQGVPISWDPIIVTVKSSHLISNVTWSPCSRFIAINLGAEIQVLDAVTLKQLKSFIPQHGPPQLLTFSPESHCLTWLSDKSKVFVSWDLQTGVQVCEIPIGESPAQNALSITYSECGIMFGVLFNDQDTTVIAIYDVLSSTPIYSHPTKGLITDTIWTCGEYVQFATLVLESIIIWEVGFISKCPPTKVRSLSTPNNFNPTGSVSFLPTLSQLAFILEGTVLVWDAKCSKFLLNSTGAGVPRSMTFSTGGCFFACATDSPEVYVWKESPTGYDLYQRLSFSNGYPCKPFLSPNGQSIAISSNSTIQLWHTADLAIFPSKSLTQAFKCSKPLILEFSPDKSFAISAHLEDNIATVLDLKSGDPWLIIDTDMKIYGLRVVGNTIVIAGNEKTVTWNLPTGANVINTRVNVNDSVQTSFNNSVPLESPEMCEVWDYHIGEGGGEGEMLIKDSGTNISKPEPHNPTGSPAGQISQQSSCHYQVTDDGWLLSSSRGRLLWLPYHWRSGEINRKWNGRFLVFLHHELEEVVILELPEE